MPVPDLIMAALFAVMVAAIGIDRALVARDALAAPQDGPARAQPASMPAPAAAPALPDLEAATRLLPSGVGWAFVSPSGQLVGTNLPRRAALLAAACAALQLEADARAAGLGEGHLAPWRMARVQGPTGLLFGQASAEGVIAAALMPPDGDEQALRERLPAALAQVSLRLSPGSASPPVEQIEG